MPRPLHAVIHSQALQHNLSRLRRAAGDARVWAVVKANAYGHGLARVYEALRGRRFCLVGPERSTDIARSRLARSVVVARGCVLTTRFGMVLAARPVACGAPRGPN